MTTIYFDTETTGLDPNVNDITELGAVLLNDKYEPTNKVFHKRLFIQNMETAQPDALAIGHYDESLWNKTAVKADIGLMEFNDWLKTVSPDTKPNMIATNAQFDKSFLFSNADRFSIMPYADNIWYDLLPFWSIYKAKAGCQHIGNSQDAICNYFGIKNVKAHAALYDAVAGAHCFKAIMDSMNFEKKK